jgi:hypothetical protein
MTSPHPSTHPSTRAERARERRQHDHIHLARHHVELLQSVRQLRQLTSRLERAGADPHSLRLAAAILDQMNTLLPDVLAREARALSPTAEAGDPWTRQAADQLRSDHGWISTNWYELSPLLDGVARQQSWADADHLRDAADLFCTLLEEHVSLATTLLARSAQRIGLEADASVQ